MTEFEHRIHYHYKNKQLMHEALTHSSFVNEGRKHIKNNQRLEFLGDSVLSIIVAQHLFEHYTHLPEGELTKLRASLVCEKSLHQLHSAFIWAIILCSARGRKIPAAVNARPFWRMRLKR